MNPIHALALTKFKPTKGNRDLCEVGEHEGTFSATFTYKLKVGEDYDQNIVASIPWQAVAVLLASKVNAATLASVVAQALASADLKPDTKEQEARIRPLVNALIASTTKTCKGKVTGQAHVTIDEMVCPPTKPARKDATFTATARKGIEITNH